MRGGTAVGSMSAGNYDDQRRNPDFGYRARIAVYSSFLYNSCMGKIVTKNKKKLTKIKFPYAEYEKSLEKILDLLIKDYWAQYSEINSHQIKVAQVYLWVAAALIGTYSTLMLKFWDEFLKSSICIQLICIISMFLVVIAFGFSLFSIPAREGYQRSEGGWGKYSKKAFEKLSDRKNSVYRDILTDLIDDFDRYTNHNLQTNCKRAKRLGTTFRLLLSSFILALIVSFGIGLQKFILNIHGGVMTKETVSNSQSSNSNRGSGNSQKPDAQPPKGPINTSPAKIITHADDSQKETKIVLTEDKDKK